MADATCAHEVCTSMRVFARGLCRRHYTADLEQRRLAGVEIRPGNDPAGNNRGVCSHCQKGIRLTAHQRLSVVDGRPTYCSRACQRAACRITLRCARCGGLTEKYRSVGYDETSRVFCGRDCLRASGSKTRSGTTEPCGNCGSPVYREPSFTGNLRFCGTSCRGEWLAGQELVERPEVPCVVCGQTMRLSPDQRLNNVRMHYGKCANKHRRRKGRTIDPSGYAWVTTPDGRNMLEHRWVMEQHIGRPLLTTETVHHRAGGFAGRSNNAIENLELWSRSHPSGHRVEDIVDYARQALALYGDPGERARYVGHLPAELTDAAT